MREYRIAGVFARKAWRAVHKTENAAWFRVLQLCGQLCKNFGSIIIFIDIHCFLVGDKRCEI